MRSIIAVALSLLSIAAAAETIEGKVVAVADGDTVTLLDSGNAQHKIRLAGIDAPEKSQAYGQASKRKLSDLVFDQVVRADCQVRPDRYGRHICVINYVGQDVNLAQVKAGYAWWYRRYGSTQTMEQRTSYEAAESAARAAHKGLWQETTPTPPWDFRHK